MGRPRRAPPPARLGEIGKKLVGAAIRISQAIYVVVEDRNSGLLGFAGPKGFADGGWPRNPIRHARRSIDLRFPRWSRHPPVPKASDSKKVRADRLGSRAPKPMCRAPSHRLVRCDSALKVEFEWTPWGG